MDNFYTSGLTYKRAADSAIIIITHICAFILSCILSYSFPSISFAILVVLGILSYLFFKTRTRDLIDLLGVFCLIWDVSIGLCQLRLSNLQTEWTVLTWVILMAVPILFWLGFSYSQSKIKVNRDNIDNPLVKKRINVNRYYRAVIIFSLIGVICELFQFLIKGYFPIFYRTVNSRLEFYTKLIIIIAGTQIIPPIAICLMTREKIGTTKKVILFLCILSIIAGPILRTSRGDTLITICTMIPTLVDGAMYRVRMLRKDRSNNYLVKKEKKNKRKFFLIALVLLVVAFAFTSNNRSESSNYLKSFFQMPYFGNEILDSKLFSFLYFYLVEGIENLDFAIRNCVSFTFGLRQLSPVSHVLPFLKPFIENLPLYRNMESTTSCLVTHMYLDFGIIGVVFGMFIFGYFSGIVHYRYKKNENYVWSGVYGVIFTICLLSFFDSWLSVSTTWIMLGLGWIFNVVVNKIRLS